MKKTLLLAFTALLLSCAASTTEPTTEPIDYVRPTLGSIHSRWFFFTPAAEPFGMAKLGASTNGT